MFYVFPQNIFIGFPFLKIFISILKDRDFSVFSLVVISLPPRILLIGVLNKYFWKGWIRSFQVTLEIYWVLSTENLKWGKKSPTLSQRGQGYRLYTVQPESANNSQRVRGLPFWARSREPIGTPQGTRLEMIYFEESSQGKDSLEAGMCLKLSPGKPSVLSEGRR